MSDEPERLLSRAQIGIADVPQSEPARQLRAPISVIRDHFGFPQEQTFIRICIGRGPEVKFWSSQTSPDAAPSVPQLGLKADRVVAHQRGRSKGPR